MLHSPFVCQARQTGLEALSLELGRGGNSPRVIFCRKALDLVALVLYVPKSAELKCVFSIRSVLLLLEERARAVPPPARDGNVVNPLTTLLAELLIIPAVDGVTTDPAPRLWTAIKDPRL